MAKGAANAGTCALPDDFGFYLLCDGDDRKARPVVGNSATGSMKTPQEVPSPHPAGRASQSRRDQSLPRIPTL